jgi:hypothetical protein
VRKGSVVTDTTKSVVLDHELEEEQKPGELEPPRILKLFSIILQR